MPPRFPADALIRAFSGLLARRPDAPLLVAHTGAASAADVDRLASAIEADIHAQGFPEGGSIGLSVPNGPAFLAALVALRRTGHAALLLDPLAPPDDHARSLSVIGACGLLECREGWPASARAVRLSSVEGQPAASPPGTAVIKLTSGSTGVPRGVAMTAEQLLADEAALASSMGLDDRDRLLAMVPMSHSYGFTTLALSALVRGLTLITPHDQGPFAPIDAARVFEATIVPTVPAYVQALVRVSQSPAWPTRLRRVITAGAVLAPSTAAAFRERYGHAVHVFYGSSECGGITYDRAGDAAERGTVGSPVDGVRIALAPMDGETGEGLVTVESPGVGAAYVPVPDRRLAGGCFETTDIAVWAGAELVLRRRSDQVINVRGRKVDPSEVERVLIALDGVDDAVVVGAGAPHGDSDIVRAFVACAPGRLEYAAVVQWCQARLADHKVPRSIVIVDALPRTARGKIDRAALATLAACRAQDGGHG